MAGCGEELLVVKQFEDWVARTSGEQIFLLEAQQNESSGAVILNLILVGEHEFSLHCFPGGKYLFEATGVIKQWADDLNSILLDSSTQMNLSDILTTAISMYGDSNTNSSAHTGTRKPSVVVIDSDEDEEMPEIVDVTEDMDEGDSNFTTEVEVDYARKRKHWLLKEQELRSEMQKQQNKKSCTAAINCLERIRDVEKRQANQMFTSTASSGVLMNDLTQIMQQGHVCGLYVEAVDNNIYQWRVKISNFERGSDLANDLSCIEERFGYAYIELQLEFAMDLYPFYPPILKVVRPLMQGSLMQRITSMEMLKLSHWNPAKDMFGMLLEIKDVLQRWARLDVNSVRNDRKYSSGSYLDIENHLLKLAMVTECVPRANSRYALPSDFAVPKALPIKQPTKEKTKTMEEKNKNGTGDKKKDGWAAGTGYGHGMRQGWDVNAYVAAQKEKDNQLELVLNDILTELVKVYSSRHFRRNEASASAVKPQESMDACSSANVSASVSMNDVGESQGDAEIIISLVTHMFDILEGSALIPALENYLKVDSFLEISRHTEVYTIVMQIIREITRQPVLLQLVGKLPEQDKSLYELLVNVESKAVILLQLLYKTGNGAPAAAAIKGGKRSFANGFVLPTAPADMGVEERLARDVVQLVRDIQAACQRAEISEEELLCGVTTTNHHVPMASADMSSTNRSSSSSSTAASSLLPANDLEATYINAMRGLQYDSCDLPTTGHFAHHYAQSQKAAPALSKDTVLRIAQEMTSLSSSLPLGLASSVFVRVDEEKATMMRALITGPEGTPYSGGCYVFDIFFPNQYPAVPPKVNLCTTGGGTVRFNPNLYNCGKVCLSLLGTWQGQEGEQWNSKTSTLLQVLVSIQSLILVPEPYFNEPGYENWIGSDYGSKQSANYNQNIRIHSIKHAMIDQLRNPYPEFEDVIKTHFFLKKDRILEEVQSWMQPKDKDQLYKAIAALKTELAKLKPPQKAT